MIYELKLILLISISLPALCFGINFRDNLHVPCSYHDTVDLSNSKKFENGSYLHDGVLIPKHLVGTYDYHLNFTIDRTSTESHIRGCICLVKKCLKWCCPFGQTIIKNQCVKFNDTVETSIMFHESENVTADINSFFFPLYDRKPCMHIYPLQPSHPDYSYDEWFMFKNGSIVNDDTILSKDEYCLATNLVFNDTLHEVTPFLCFTDNDLKAREVLYSSAMLLSVPFMLITIFIYISLPELRNLHGKSLSCYLFGLVIGYSILGYLLITGGSYLNLTMCLVLGYLSYWSFMSAFLWLSVISFDLWWNFRGIQGRNRFNDKKRFLFYSIYAWGLSTLFLILTYFAQNSNLPKKYKPGIGDARCWLNVDENFSAAIYFFGPLIILITFNVVMFIMTSWKIHHVQRELSKIIAKEDSKKNFRSEKDQFGHFLRLFIVMGVTWSMEIISYLLGPNSSLDSFFYITDFCNAIQGFLIFALFVLKSKVKKLIIKRYKKDRNFYRTSQYSSKTNSSHINLTALNLNGPPTSTPLMEAPKFF